MTVWDRKKRDVISVIGMLQGCGPFQGSDHVPYPPLPTSRDCTHQSAQILTFLLKMFDAGGEEVRISCAAPLSLSLLLGSVVFPLPGGRGAREERGRRGHHVHPQLRGPGAADRQEHRAEPAPAPVQELEQRWVCGAGGGAAQHPQPRGLPGSTGGLKDAPGSGQDPAQQEVCVFAQPQLCKLRDCSGQTPAGWEKAL